MLLQEQAQLIHDVEQGGTFTVNGSLETDSRPDVVYQTLVDYPNLPSVFKNLDDCKTWTEGGQKKLLQVGSLSCPCMPFIVFC